MLVHTPRGSRPRQLTILVAVVAALLTAVAGAAPARAASPFTPGAPRTWNVQVGQESHDAAIQGMAFGPSEIWINVGDTVHWVANSMEIHTVNFGLDPNKLPPFDFSSPAAQRTPQKTIAKPTDIRNSGVMATMDAPYTTYDLTFTAKGDFPYICIIHGKAMMGMVHVRSAGTAYPYIQQQYDAQATQLKAQALAHGAVLRAQAQAASSPTHVFVGAADDTAMVMRFIRPTVRVHVGDTVTFDMARNGVPVPHTVTFGAPRTLPGGQEDMSAYGTPGHYTGGQLSSGTMLPPNFGPPFIPTSFKVTFAKAGTYDYVCLQHDHMGMVGTVIVES